MRRILVLGSARSRGALAGVRALGRAGWTVSVGAPTPGGPAARSRFATSWHEVPFPGDGDGFDDRLRRAVDAASADVVAAAGDDWMLALALAAAGPSLGARVAHAPLATLLRAVDKRSLTVAALDGGLAAPRTSNASGEAVAGWEGPAVVKPRLHWAPGRSSGPRVDAVLATTPEAIESAVAAVRATGGEPVLQEPVSGELMALAGVFVDGGLVGRVQQRAIRVHPAMGISSRAETVAVDEALAGGVVRMLTALEWFGLAQVQFLRGTDGVPKVIDLNGRFYGSMALAARAGVNLPDLLARATTGEHIASRDARPGARYVRLEGEMPRLVEQRSARETAAAIRFSIGAVQAVWDARDPMPVLGQVTARAARLARR